MIRRTDKARDKSVLRLMLRVTTPVHVMNSAFDRGLFGVGCSLSRYRDDVCES